MPVRFNPADLKRIRVGSAGESENRIGMDSWNYHGCDGGAIEQMADTNFKLGHYRKYYGFAIFAAARLVPAVRRYSPGLRPGRSTCIAALTAVWGETTGGISNTFTYCVFPSFCQHHA